jgi:hypothetical protein
MTFVRGTRIYPAAGAFRQEYVVSHDGTNILMNMSARDVIAPPIALILDWNGPASPR